MALEDVVQDIAKDQPDTPAGSQAQPTTGSPEAAVTPEYADALQAFRDAGFKPEEARDAARHIAHIRTEQGQREYYAGLYQEAQNMMAREIGTPEGLAKWDGIAQAQRQRLGVPVNGANDEALTPEEREIKSLKAQIGQLNSKFEGLQGNTQRVAEATGNLEADTIRANTFREWKNEQKDIPPSVILKLSKKFVDEVGRNPRALRDSASVRSYFNDGLSDFREAHSAFSSIPKPKVVPTRSDVGNPNADRYKGITDPAKRLDKMMEDAAEGIDTPRG